MILWLRVAIVAAILIFLPGPNEAFEGVKVAAVRALGCGAMAAGVASLIASRRRTSVSLVDVAVMTWLAVEALTTATSIAPSLSLVGEPIQREGLFTSVALAGLYLAGRLGIRTPENVQRTLDCALIAAAIASLYALVQSTGHDFWTWVPPPGTTLRPFGTLGHQNLLGVVTAASVSIAVARSAAASRPRAVTLVAVGVFLAATVVTLSRAAWLGTAAGVIAAVVLARAARRGPHVLRTVVLLAGVLVLVVAGARVAGQGARLAQRLSELIAPMSGSGASRLEIWRTALVAFHERPGLGFGPDTFGLVFPRLETAAYFLREWGGLAFHAHSIYLQVLATRGVVGILAAAFVGVAMFREARAAWRAPDARATLATLGSATVALAVAGAFGAIGISGAVLVVCFAATLASLARNAAAPVDPGTPRGVDPGGARQRAIAGLVGVVIAAAVAIRTGSDVLAAVHATRARQWLDLARSAGAGVPGEAVRTALAEARAATRLGGCDDIGPRLESEALLGLGAAARDRTALDAATAAARVALDRVPPRIEGLEQLARTQVARALSGERDQAPEALGTLSRIVESCPHNPLVIDEACRLALILGRADRAAEWNGRVLALYPEWGGALETLADIRLAGRDSAGARGALVRAADAMWHGDSTGASRVRQRLRDLH